MPGTVKKLQFSEGTDVGAPSDLSLQTSTSVIKSYADDAAYVTGEGPAVNGSIYLNSTLNKLRHYIGGAWRNCVPESDSADPTKRFLIDLTGTTTGKTATLDFNHTDNRTATFPDVDITVAGRANAETLSNKTLLNALLSGSLDVAAAGNFAIGASVGAHNLDLGGSSSTVRILGNFEVLGTSTTINTATLDVEDLNITVNKGGNDLSSEGAGLTVDRTGTKGSIIYADAAATKWKIGSQGSEIEAVDISTAQVIANKRLHLHTTAATNNSTSPRLVLPQNTLANLQAITSGNHPNEGAVYWATDVDKPYVWNGTALVALGSGSGSGTGATNYILNPDAEADTSGWATYKDLAGTAPVDGTGGSPALTFTRSTSSPLRGTASFLISKGAANLQGEGASYAFTLDSADVSKTLQISFDVDATDTNYVAGDLNAYIYDVTNSVLITPAAIAIQKAKYQFQTTFVASTSTSYRLIIHNASSTNTNAYAVKIDNVIVGPQLLTLGTASSPWESFTPSISGYSGGTTIAYKRREGQNLKITGSITSPTSWTGVLTFTLPDSLSIDPTAIAAVGIFQNAVGTANIFDNSGGVIFSGICTIESLTTIRFAGALTTGNNWTQVYPLTLQNGSDKITFEFSIPIAQWAGSGVYLSTAQPEYAYNSSTANANDTTSFAYGPFGAQFINIASTGVIRRVRFLTPIQATDQIKLQFFKINSWFDSGAFADIVPFTRQSGTEYGVYFNTVSGSTTDVDVFITGYRLPTSATFGAAGADWSAIAATNNYRWRLVKVPGQVQVAIPQYPTATSMPDSIATALGYKTYIAGSNYNAGIAISFTGSPTITNTRIAHFIPYQSQDGSWRMKFNFEVTVASGTRTSATFTISGITFANTAGDGANVSGTIYQFANAVGAAVATSNSNTVVIGHGSVTTGQYGATGDVPLASKPTWAY